MDLFNERIARIEDVLAQVLPDKVDSHWISRVAGADSSEALPEWADRFLEPGRELLRRGGKRWRPLVTVLTCEALGGGRAADILAPLTEIPHNGSLIVDDIEDASTTRRGGPAIHTVFGEDLAINMGNLMYFLPTIVLDRTDFDVATLAAISRDWLAVMRRLHLGQGYDILWHREAALFPDIPSYLRMCRFKTGSLAGIAAVLGARAAAVKQKAAGRTSESGAAVMAGVEQSGAGPETVQIDENLIQDLGRSWESLGTGFQILDDVQNLSSGIPGKDRGDDIVEGKKSLPVIRHIAENPRDAEPLVKLFATAAKRAPKGDWSAVEEAIALLNRSGSIDRAREDGQELLRNGRDRLMSQLPDTEGRSLMMELIDMFIRKMV